MTESAKDVKSVMEEDKVQQENQSNQSLTMPWIVLSNQIQSMERNLNQRLDDFKADVDRRFEQVDKRFEQVDKRFDQVDKRMGGIESRLSNRMNAWLAVVLMVLTALLGFLLAHVKF